MLQINELLKFQKPGPFVQFKHFMKEQKTGEWSVEKLFEI